MKKLLKFIGINRRPGGIALDKAEKKELFALSSKRFTDLDHEGRRRLLEISAKDFSRKFSGVIKDLSRE
jgi:hypothetical protein